MKCRCGGDTKVIDVASNDEPSGLYSDNGIGFTYRIRKCTVCGLIFPTYEVARIKMKGCKNIEDCVKKTKKQISFLKALKTRRKENERRNQDSETRKEE